MKILNCFTPFKILLSHSSLFWLSIIQDWLNEFVIALYILQFIKYICYKVYKIFETNIQI